MPRHRPANATATYQKKGTRTLLPTLHTWPAWPLLPTPFLLRRLVRSGRACLPWDVPSEWHLPSITRSKSLAYPVAPAPSPCGRPPLPTLSGAATRNICKAPRARVKHGGRSGLPPASPLPVRRKANVPLMPGPAIPSAHARQEGTHVVRPGRPNLTKSSSRLCLPCTFPPARRFRPCGLWQPSLGGTPQ